MAAVGRNGRTGRAASAALAIACVSSLAAPAASLAGSVTATPQLNPAWRSDQLDYTTSCDAGSVRLSLKPSKGKPLAVDGKAASTSTRSVTVRLTPGQRTTVTEGTGKTAVARSIRCLPSDFPRYDVAGRLPASTPFLAMSLLRSFTGAPTPYAFVVDSRGVPVWWKRTPGLNPIDVKPVAGGKIGFWQGQLDDRLSDGPFVVVKLDGTLDRSFSVASGNGDLHESTPTSRGTVYRIAGSIRPGVNLSSVGGGANRSVIDHRIEEIDRDGNVLWQWSTIGRFAITDTASRFWNAFWVLKSPDPLDEFHMNSIEEDGNGGLIVSFRHLDAVLRIRKSDGSIDWKLSGSPSDRTLTVIGDGDWPALPLSGQHDARVQPDGTITIFDNGGGKPRLARATRWRIDRVQRTATLVESITGPGSSSALGSARRNPADGSWVISWGAGLPYVRAYDSRHRQLFGIGSGASGYAYRAAPVYPSLATRSQFLAGMDSMYPRTG